MFDHSGDPMLWGMSPVQAGIRRANPPHIGKKLTRAPSS
jgi:hypothetical protein